MTKIHEFCFGPPSTMIEHKMLLVVGVSIFTRVDLAGKRGRLGSLTFNWKFGPVGQA